MALLFAELGEAYLHLIATAVQEVQGPVEALLEVAAHPEARVAALSFNFWHKLAKALTSGWGPRDVGADSTSADASPSASHAVPPADVAAGEMARRRAFFTPAYERLVVLVRGRVR
ncbi:importin N-terminal domain-containing protein [Haematococcus lacustris]|uniref:Importin N-terminal domain-containing protein n=1 Tax=Haematococcus lacustris TaxID=44745 RepID=A0A6A0A6W7_HAELA|nr:importin N-terminal domain-containing protein [Haematococcus lacustris]